MLMHYTLLELEKKEKDRVEKEVVKEPEKVEPVKRKRR